MALEGALKLSEISSIEEVRSCGGAVAAVVAEGDEHNRSLAEDVFELPELLSWMVSVVPLQLLGYHAAVMRGKDVGNLLDRKALDSLMSMSFRLSLFRLHRQRRQQHRDMREWAQRAYAAPVPMNIKRSVLLRLGLPDATWIETGTYYGDTTALLSRSAKSVISIEPAQQLAARAVRRFRATSNVRIVFGSSDECLGAELAGVRGDANFWLDGHYSGGPTYCGATECPVNAELTCIAAARPRLGRIVVLIDDARMFGCGEPRHPDYPPLDDLVAWARSQGLTWHVEHDIFVARTPE